VPYDGVVSTVVLANSRPPEPVSSPYNNIGLEALFNRLNHVALASAAYEPKPKASKLGFESLPVTVREAQD